MLEDVINAMRLVPLVRRTETDADVATPQPEQEKVPQTEEKQEDVAPAPPRNTLSALRRSLSFQRTEKTSAEPRRAPVGVRKLARSISFKRPTPAQTKKTTDDPDQLEIVEDMKAVDADAPRQSRFGSFIRRKRPNGKGQVDANADAEPNTAADPEANVEEKSKPEQCADEKVISKDESNTVIKEEGELKPKDVDESVQKVVDSDVKQSDATPIPEPTVDATEEPTDPEIKQEITETENDVRPQTASPLGVLMRTITTQRGRADNEGDARSSRMKRFSLARNKQKESADEEVKEPAEKSNTIDKVEHDKVEEVIVEDEKAEGARKQPGRLATLMRTISAPRIRTGADKKADESNSEKPEACDKKVEMDTESKLEEKVDSDSKAEEVTESDAKDVEVKPGSLDTENAFDVSSNPVDEEAKPQSEESDKESRPQADSPFGVLMRTISAQRVRPENEGEARTSRIKRFSLARNKQKDSPEDEMNKEDDEAASHGADGKIGAEENSEKPQNIEGEIEEDKGEEVDEENPKAARTKPGRLAALMRSISAPRIRTGADKKSEDESEKTEVVEPANAESKEEENVNSAENPKDDEECPQPGRFAARIPRFSLARNTQKENADADVKEGEENVTACEKEEGQVRSSRMKRFSLRNKQKESTATGDKEEDEENAKTQGTGEDDDVLEEKAEEAKADEGPTKHRRLANLMRTISAPRIRAGSDRKAEVEGKAEKTEQPETGEIDAKEEDKENVKSNENVDDEKIEDARTHPGRFVARIPRFSIGRNTQKEGVEEDAKDVEEGDVKTSEDNEGKLRSSRMKRFSLARNKQKECAEDKVVDEGKEIVKANEKGEGDEEVSPQQPGRLATLMRTISAQRVRTGGDAKATEGESEKTEKCDVEVKTEACDEVEKKAETKATSNQEDVGKPVWQQRWGRR